MTPDLWFPPAIKAIVPRHSSGAGAWLTGLPKIVHHITGGGTYAGAFATYAKTGSLPHFTTSFEGGTFRVWQHLPLDTAATALKHDPPTLPQTNRARAIQIEHVVPSIDAVHFLPPGFYDGVAVLCRWIEAAFGVERRAPYPFLNPHRLSWDQWAYASGHLGHCHVPGNDHPDPGPIDIAHILNAGAPTAAPTPPPLEEDDMPTAIDPQTGGLWICPPDGGVRAEAGARYLGSLPAHPEWNAGQGKANGPAIAIGAVGDGYTVFTQDPAGQIHPYHFPGDGSLR